MKRWLTLMISVFSIAAVAAQTRYGNNLYIRCNCDPHEYIDAITPGRLRNLKRNVRLLSVFEYRCDKDLVKTGMSGGSVTFSLVFDTGKYITQEWGYRHSKNVASKRFYHDYRANAEDSFILFNDSGQVIKKQWMVYDENDLVIEEKSVYKGSPAAVYFAVEKIGDTIVYYAKDYQAKYVAKKIVESTSYGRFVSRYMYNTDGTLHRQTLRTDGRLDGIVEFNSAGDPAFFEDYTYSESGVLIEKSTKFRTYGRNQEELEERWVVEKHGTKMQQVTKFVYRDKRLVSKTENGEVAATYRYNEKGDLIEKVEFGGKEEYKYPIYDAKGNWLKCIRYFNNVPQDITEREIEYYP